MKKYSLVHLTRMSWTPPEMIYNAALAGFDYVSPRTINRGAPTELVHDIANNKELFELTAQAVKDTGVNVIDIELVKINDTLTNVRDFAPDLDAAARLGVRNLTTNIWTANVPFYEEKFGELCDLAAEYDMSVNLEYVTWSNVKNLSESLALIKKCGRKNARVAFDLLHAFRSGDTVEDIAACPRELVAPVSHVCDAPAEIDPRGLAYTAGNDRLCPGEGAFPVADAVKAMPCDTILGLEIPNAERVRKLGAMEYVRRILEKSKKYFAENGII